MSAQTAAALRAAKKLIDKPTRWCRFVFKNDAGAYCASGAIAEACGDLQDGNRPKKWSTTTVAAFVALHTAAKIAPPTDGRETVQGAIARWNNHRATRHKELLAAFDKAIRAEARKP